MTWALFLGNLVIGCIIAGLSAWLTVRLALKRFVSEKWWERKSDAYTSIFEALHYIRDHADHNLVIEKKHLNLPEDLDKSLNEKMIEGVGELRKRVDLGDFVISEEAVLALQQLMEALDASTKTKIWHEHLQMKIAAIDRCLDLLRPIAKKDLMFS